MIWRKWNPLYDPNGPDDLYFIPINGKYPEHVIDLVNFCKERLKEESI